MSWVFSEMLYEVPYALMMVVALFLVIRYRKRAQKATNLALIAWFGLAGWGSYDIFMIAAGYDVLEAFGRDLWWPIVHTQGVVKGVGYAACLLLLCVAIGTDRSERATAPVGVSFPRGSRAVQVLAVVTVILAILAGCVWAIG